MYVKRINYLAKLFNIISKPMTTKKKKIHEIA
jgi:hypothetical protein